jgi:phosphomannomutase
MRAENALFAGEGSGHFYFRDFYYADNGLIPFLLVLENISQSNKKVSELFDGYFGRYYTSGEINTELRSADQVPVTLKRVEDKFKNSPIDRTDGISLENSDWRANIRSSNTQPLIRLNVEAQSEELLKQKTEELLGLIRQ